MSSCGFVQILYIAVFQEFQLCEPDLLSGVFEGTELQIKLASIATNVSLCVYFLFLKYQNRTDGFLPNPDPPKKSAPGGA